MTSHKREVKTNFCLTEDVVAVLAKVCPHVTFTQHGELMPHTHPASALERRVTEEDAIEIIRATPIYQALGRIVDAGGSARRHHQFMRHDVHSASPLESSKDFFSALKSMHLVNFCQCRVQDCPHVPGSILFFNDSIYYFTAQSVVEQMLRSGSNYAVSVHHAFVGPSGNYLGESRWERHGAQVIMEVGGGERYEHNNVDWIRENRVVRTPQGWFKLASNVARDNGVKQTVEFMLVPVEAPACEAPSLGNGALTDSTAYGSLNLSDAKTSKWVNWAGVQGHVLSAYSLGPWVFVTTTFGQAYLPKTVVTRLRIEFSCSARTENNLKCMVARSARLCSEVQMPIENVIPTAHACAAIAFHIDRPSEDALLRTVRHSINYPLALTIGLLLLVTLARPSLSAAGILEANSTGDFLHQALDNVYNATTAAFPTEAYAHAKDYLYQWFAPRAEDAAEKVGFLAKCSTLFAKLLVNDAASLANSTYTKLSTLFAAHASVLALPGSAICNVTGYVRWFRPSSCDASPPPSGLLAKLGRVFGLGAMLPPIASHGGIVSSLTGDHLLELVGWAIVIYHLTQRRFYFLFAAVFNMALCALLPAHFVLCLLTPIFEELCKSFDRSAAPFYTENLVFGRFSPVACTFHFVTQRIHRQPDGLYCAILMHVTYNSFIWLMFLDQSQPLTWLLFFGALVLMTTVRSNISQAIAESYQNGIALWPSGRTLVHAVKRFKIPPIHSDTPLGPLQSRATVENHLSAEPQFNSFGTQINGIGFGPFFPTAYAKSPGNEERAVVNRQQLPTECDEQTVHDYTHFLQDLPACYIRRYDVHVNRTQWLERFPETVRAKLTTALKSLLAHAPTPATFSRILFRPAFIKQEKANTSTKFGTKVSDPRLVQSANPTLNVIWGPFFYALSQAWKRIFGAQSITVWAAGMTGDSLGEQMYFTQHLRPDGVFIENDCSRFDASVQRPLLMLRELVYNWYMNIYELCPLGISYARLLKIMVDKRGITPWGIRYTTNATVASGDGDTSLWNFFLNSTADLFAYVTNPVFEGLVTVQLLVFMMYLLDPEEHTFVVDEQYAADALAGVRQAGYPLDDKHMTRDATAHILWSCLSDQKTRMRDPLIDSWLLARGFDVDSLCHDLNRIGLAWFHKWCFYKSFTNGDDFIAYQSAQPALAHRHQVYKNLGFRPKFRWYKDIARAEFCSAVYMPAYQPIRLRPVGDDGEPGVSTNWIAKYGGRPTIDVDRHGKTVQYFLSYVLTIKPGRTLTKAGFASEPYSDDDSLSVQRGTAICIMHDGNHFPLFTSYAAALLRCTPGVKSVEFEHHVIRNTGEAICAPEHLHKWIIARYGAQVPTQIAELMDTLARVDKIPCVIDTDLLDIMAEIDNGWAATADATDSVERPLFRPMPPPRPFRDEPNFKNISTEDSKYERMTTEEKERLARQLSIEFTDVVDEAEPVLPNRNRVLDAMAGMSASEALAVAEHYETKGGSFGQTRSRSELADSKRGSSAPNGQSKKKKKTSRPNKGKQRPHVEYNAIKPLVDRLVAATSAERQALVMVVFTILAAALEEVFKRVTWTAGIIISLMETRDLATFQLHLMVHALFSMMPLWAAIPCHALVNLILQHYDVEMDRIPDRAMALLSLILGCLWWPLGLVAIIAAALSAGEGKALANQYRNPLRFWILMSVALAYSNWNQNKYEFNVIFRPALACSGGLRELTRPREIVRFDFSYALASPYDMSQQKQIQRNVSSTRRRTTRRRTRALTPAERSIAGRLLATVRQHPSGMPGGILDSFIGAASSLYSAVTGGSLVGDAVNLGKKAVTYAVDWLGDKLTGKEEAKVGPVEQELYHNEGGRSAGRHRGKRGSSAAPVDKKRKRVSGSVPRPVSRSNSVGLRSRSVGASRPSLKAHPHWTGKFKYANPPNTSRFAEMQALLTAARSRALAKPRGNGDPAPVQYDNQIPNMGFSMEMGSGVHSDDIILHGCEYVRAVPLDNPATSTAWAAGDVITIDNMAPADFPYLPRVDAISPLYTMYDADFEHIICPVADTSTSGGFAACYIPDPDEDITALSPGDRVRSAFMHPGSVSNNWWTPTSIKMPHQDGKFYLTPGSDARLVSQGKFAMIASTSAASDSAALAVLLIRYSIRFKTARIDNAMERAGSIGFYARSASPTVALPFGPAGPVRDAESTLDLTFANASNQIIFDNQFGNNTHCFKIRVTGTNSGSGGPTGTWSLNTSQSINVAVDTATILGLSGGAPGSTEYGVQGASTFASLSMFSLYAPDPLTSSHVVIDSKISSAWSATGITDAYLEVYTVQYDSPAIALDHFKDELATLTLKLNNVAQEVKRYEDMQDKKESKREEKVAESQPVFIVEEGYDLVQRTPQSAKFNFSLPSGATGPVRRSLKA